MSDKPTIVLVHGFWGGAAHWSKVVVELSLKGYPKLLEGVHGGLASSHAVVRMLASVQWVTRSPWLAIRAVQLEGDLTRYSLATLRANAMPKVAGNFFGVDLQASRAAFEAVPWVRHAVVRRVWPDRLVVSIEEQSAAALWQGNDSGDQLVNRQGEVFEANVAEVEEESLPMFSGPAGSAAQMLAMYRRLAPLVEGMDSGAKNASDNGIDSLALSGRGSWRLVLNSGAAIELGRGSEDEVLTRAERFIATLPAVRGKYDKPLEYADLRHTDGYALRLRGVTTGGAAVQRGAVPPQKTH